MASVTPVGETTYNVSVSGMSHDGPVTVTVPAGAAHDAAGNPNVPSTGANNTVTFSMSRRRP